MRILILILLLSGIAYAETQPKMLIDKNTKQIISWGYIDFKPTENQEVIEGIYLKENINDGLKYDGKVISAPEFKIITPKTIEERLSIVESEIETLKGK